MLAYRLRHRVTFQTLQTVRDPNSGARDKQWLPAVLSDGTVMEGVPAEVLTGPGKQQMAAGGQQETAALRVNCRYFPGLTAEWRVLWNGKPYAIIGEPEMDLTAAREWRIKCTGGLTDGQ